MRTLVLTVADPIQYMEGRRMPRHQAEPRWIDAYQVCCTSEGKSLLLYLRAADTPSPGGARWIDPGMLQSTGSSYLSGCLKQQFAR